MKLSKAQIEGLLAIRDGKAYTTESYNRRRGMVTRYVGITKRTVDSLWKKGLIRRSIRFPGWTLTKSGEAALYEQGTSCETL